ncbi:MAG: DUF4350 domain-containing protein [Halobacteria archaeon]
MKIGKYEVEPGYPHLALVTLLVLMVSVAVYGTLTSTNDLGGFNPDWNGTSELRDITEENSKKQKLILFTIEYGDTSNDSLSLIVGPQVDYTKKGAERIGNFVKEGGTVLVASEFTDDGNRLFRLIGADSRFGSDVLRDDERFRNSPEFPKTSNIANSSLFSNVSTLVLNHPTYLKPNGSKILVNTSEFSYADLNRNGELDDNETMKKYPVITVEKLGEGKIYAVSDPSIFINSMMDIDGNRKLVENAAGLRKQVAVDYSHSPNFPTGSLYLTYFRKYPNYRSVLVLVGVLLAGLITIRRGRDQIKTAWYSTTGRYLPYTNRTMETETGVGEMTVEDGKNYLLEKHPNWSEERVEEVIRNIQRGDEEGNDG